MVMKIKKSLSQNPTLETNVWISKIPHGLELAEAKSKGADRRYSVTTVELSNLEFIKCFKVTLAGKLPKCVINVLSELLWRLVK